MQEQSEDDSAERVGSTEEIARLHALALAELAAMAEELRCYAADLSDEVHRGRLNPNYLRPTSATINDLADRLARASEGYREVRASDMLYPAILEDLETHRWEPRPDRDLDGTIPPVPVTELGASLGYRRGWRRGTQTITLWFTAPGAIAYGTASGHGRLGSTKELRAVIAAQPPRPPCPFTVKEGS